MIDLYTARTPNGIKASIMLEELGLKYQVHAIDISGAKEQFSEDFLALNPFHKIPVIVDSDVSGEPITVFESGAILVYLAEKYQSHLLPAEPALRARVLSWVFAQVGGQGPMIGQLNHFARFADEQIPYALKRYESEVEEVFKAMERQLGRNDYLAGTYSIADIIMFPWAYVSLNLYTDFMGELLAPYEAVKAWSNRIIARPAVQKGSQVPSAN